MEELTADLNTTEFLTDEELFAEIEYVIFGNLVTREEYLEEVIDRTGMRRRLSRGQRETVWAIREEMVTEMESAKRYSKNYARVKILEALRARPTDARMRDIRYLFLDETQDLAACDLAVLREITGGHMIMAGDADQSIYTVSSPYARAGIDLSGRVRVLRTNFRNTRPIHELGERFRGSLSGAGAPAAGHADYAPAVGDNRPYAFREGPYPELYEDDDPHVLLSLLLRKLRLFLDELEYAPESLCILAPHRKEVDRIATALAEVGVPAAVITEREFRFETEGRVRLSTLHSAKGLDFPVGLLYLPYLHRPKQYDERAGEALVRNLLYVGITRAMENLDVFMTRGDDPVLADLAEAFRSLRA
jgi:superfamily I DNA/RNA helicase